MAIRTKTQLLEDIVAYVKSGGNPSLTTAQNLRSLFVNFVETLFAQAGVTWESLSGKPSTFPPSAHGHTTGNITDVQVPYNAAVTPTGTAPTVTYDFGGKIDQQNQLTLTSDSTGDVTIAVIGSANGSAMTIVVKNNDSISRDVKIPSGDTGIGIASHTVAVPSGKYAVLCVSYIGTIGLWKSDAE
ncbi:hypothetical protein SAMN05421780_101535 [Flexibacter flexilis DSM 6793]|uniref:Uncharacterized protein n=1 Tax=Flexibacter flexilis DSM 6793 TaxID=927664 RepID=A0A1I1DYU6_9BACT|nr:hypothetical protein [Flexibacter flexilis]SFB79977.1 hypothetical protein SAMN05421780_101535 [Flexibacter flexilis DSM 6793]